MVFNSGWSDLPDTLAVEQRGDAAILRLSRPAKRNAINPEMLKWVAMLDEAGLATALLSNMQHDMAAYARKNFSWLKHFDHQILSCELQLIKPDPAIFQKSIERIGAKPQEILFVDDRQANIDGAKSTGIAAVRFENTKQLREELRELKFPVLPPTTADLDTA